MSLFRTLQHSPATLTIFHDATIPLSNILYKALSRAHFNLKDNSKHEFQIDLMQNKMPTLDQYQSLVRNCLPDSRSKSILHGCYPFLHDRRTLGSSHSEIVTTRGSVSYTHLDVYKRQIHILLLEEIPSTWAIYSKYLAARLGNSITCS